MEPYSDDQIRELEKENQLLKEHSQILEDKLNGLIQLIEQTLEKAESLKANNSLLADRIITLSNENIYLANGLQEMRNSYLSVFKENEQNKNEIKDLRRVLMEQKGFQDEKEFEKWLKEALLHEIEMLFQA